MKRSKAIYLITAALKNVGLENCPDYDVYEEPTLEQGEKILNIVERVIKMQPPAYMKPIEFFEGNQYPLIPGDFKNEEGVWCTPGVNEWEPEDD